MKGTVLYGPGDVRFENRETPKIVEPTDAVIRIAATCVCGSDLWPYRGLQPINEPTPMGNEYCGIVEEMGRAVQSLKPGQFVVGSFATSDNTCPNCRYGYQSSCIHREFMTRAQAPVLRVPLADGTLVPTPDVPPDELPADNVGRAGHRLVRRRRGQRQAGVDRGGRRRRRGGPARRSLCAADGGRADYRDEPPREAATTRPRVRRDRHCLRARRRWGGPCHGADQGRRRRFGAGVRWHAAVDDAGHPLHA